MPFALLTARLLMPYGHVMRRLALAAACIVGGTIILFSPIDALDGRIAAALGVPGQSGYRVVELCSGKWQASVLNKYVGEDDVIVSYGEYQTSVVYYAGHMVYDLIPAAKYAERTSTTVDWQRKYVMPVLTFEELPRDRDVYLLWDKRRNQKIDEHLSPEEWQLLAEKKHIRIYKRIKHSAAEQSIP